METPKSEIKSGDTYRVTWERWDEVDSLFDRVLDLSEEERARVLEEIGAVDPEIANAVLKLLGAAQRVPGGLSALDPELLGAAVAKSPAATLPSLEPGERLGQYRLIGEVGRGGMATVYEAERADGAFTRRVAVKVLRGGGAESEELIRRSLVERQILSGLQHPNIATLLDGGATADGRPFLVMELVEGEPITTWADERRLATRERIDLFLQVAEAVSYAHSQLIVHRDLKPSNVLVTPNGQVKLLDFGVAKLLDGPEPSEGPVTRLGPAPMTPEFASPEQLRGERVTPTSDVFQLGVLLYRLLTDCRPFEGDTVRKRLLDVEVHVTRPSDATQDRNIARALRGDLDTIVLKALQTNPTDRYRSADALTSDLRLHLAGRPIVARPASPWVRVKKFSRRNPWFWPVAASLAIGIGGYVGTVVRYSDRLELERNEALAQADRAEALRGFMVNQFGLADPFSDEPVRPDVTVVEAMSLGAATARRELSSQPLLQADMLSAIAQVYANLSLLPDAQALLHEAMDIRRGNGGETSPEQIEDIGTLGSVLGAAGQLDSARVLLRQRADLERSMFGEHPRTADALEDMSWRWFEDGEFQQSLEWYEEAVRIRRTFEPVDSASLSASLATLADSYRSMDRWEEALAAAQEAYDISRREFGEEHAITAGNKGHLAQVVHGRGDLDEAEALYREALPVLERTLGELHASTLANWNNLGTVLHEAGDLDGAEEVQSRILELRRERYGTESHANIASSLQNLAAIHVRQGRLVEADSLARSAEAIFRTELGDEHYSVAFSLLTQTEAALLRGQGSSAEQLALRAIEILEPLFGDRFPTAAARCRLGRALALQNRTAQARGVLSASVELLDANGVPPLELATCRDAMASLDGSNAGG